MTLNGAFEADVDLNHKEDIDKTLNVIPFVTTHFFTGLNKDHIVIKIACNTNDELNHLQGLIGKFQGFSNFKAYPPEETGLSRVQKQVIVRALVLAGIIYGTTFGVVLGANPNVVPLYLWGIPFVTAGASFGYEFYYEWPRANAPLRTT